MILSCDPPRHAFLIHFGKREQPPTVKLFEGGYRSAQVQFALDLATSLPTLVAIHFVRYGFWLPFIEQGSSSVHEFHLQYGLHERKYFFHFSFVPRDCEECELYPGLTVLLSGPVRYNFGSPDQFEERPVLRGLLINTEVLDVKIDPTEFIFEMSTDNLKDVPVNLFFTNIRS